MTVITQMDGYLTLFLFGFAMLAITMIFANFERWRSKMGFLLANREVGWLLGGASIAASWIWAPALFISSQVAYQKGLAGIFWFVVPNAAALAIFSLLAPKIRSLLPEGYTLPQYMRHRLQSERVHKIYLLPYFFYQLMAVAVQLFAGGSLLAFLTGIPLTISMPILAGIVLAYTLISGFGASVVTDFIQMAMIYLAILVVVPMAIFSAGGLDAVLAGTRGLENTDGFFDPGVAFSFGIVSAIGLISGAISDQQYWQRAFAIKRNQLSVAFIFGAVLFAAIPIMLSALGLIAANPVAGIALPKNVDVSLIGVQTVLQLLPNWTMLLFVLMLLCGLASTLDSGMMAASSLWVTDVAKPKSDKDAVREGRLSIIGITVLGLAVAYGTLYLPGFGLKQLWWIFNTIAACVVVPTLLSLYWNRLDERGVFWGVLVSFIVGIPLFVYGNIINDAVWIVGASLFIIGVSTLTCLLMPRKTPWKPDVLGA